LLINGVSVNKVTHVLPTDIINNSDVENVFGGTVFASSDSDISKPTLILNSDKYLVKYVYERDGVVSIDDQEYKDAVEDMDSIIESVVIK